MGNCPIVPDEEILKLSMAQVSGMIRFPETYTLFGMMETVVSEKFMRYYDNMVRSMYEYKLQTVEEVGTPLPPSFPMEK